MNTMKIKLKVMRIYWLLNRTRVVDWLAPLGFRLYLAPIFIIFGLNKLNNFESVVAWFGNPDGGLGLPMPALLAGLAIAAELIGGFALLIGLAVRWMTIPLMITMLVAALTAHASNGWYYVAPTDPNTNIAKITRSVGFPGAQESFENSVAVNAKLTKAREILQEHGDYKWLTEKGNFVILNNGMELAVTYFLMLLSLFFTGAGRFVSFDYWINKKTGLALLSK
ncbi:MAG: DoxX family protein [Pseudomonadota bacterium]